MARVLGWHERSEYEKCEVLQLRNYGVQGTITVLYRLVCFGPEMPWRGMLEKTSGGVLNRTRA